LRAREASSNLHGSLITSTAATSRSGSESSSSLTSALGNSNRSLSTKARRRCSRIPDGACDLNRRKLSLPDTRGVIGEQLQLFVREPGESSSCAGQRATKDGVSNEHKYYRNRLSLPPDCSGRGSREIAKITSRCKSTSSFVNIRIRSSLPAGIELRKQIHFLGAELGL
jgi:hypothetical protein